MKKKRIVITGGSGFIGRSLVECWQHEHDITVISRQEVPTANNVRYCYWDGIHTGSWCDALEGADVIINLAGKSVNCRYNEQNKQEIFDSRTATTRILGKAIAQLKHPPKLWINAASATIYRHAEDRPMDEFTGEMMNDFSVQVCKQWEQTFNELTLPGTRKVILRMGIVLGWQDGGVLQPYMNLLKLGLGGFQGNGQQKYTWIHIADVAGMMMWFFENEHLTGVFNCTSPNPVSNKTFMKTLRQATGHLFGLPAPAFLLKMGAAVIGTEAELLLKSRWVLPARALKEGYIFQYPELSTALNQILTHVPRSAYHLF